MTDAICVHNEQERCGQGEVVSHLRHKILGTLDSGTAPKQ